MLIGEYTSKIGERKRVAIPKKIRQELGDKLILTRGYENALVMVNTEMWETLAKEVINGSFINKNIRDTSRFLVGSASELEPDPQGRVVIPSGLYQHAGFTKEIVFIGLVNWVELWDTQKWNERMSYISDNSDQISEELIKATQNG
ncbi:division/cell wall cluster transcriptional repressor MraZ [Candidatus Nomurabacteria bacterium]|nr:division/cell wall cluster transcriptional repressor MraZ [Candidatus Nomurabacteria bacterium]